MPTPSRAALSLFVLPLPLAACGAPTPAGGCPAAPPVDSRPSDPNYEVALDEACRWASQHPDRWTLGLEETSRAAGFHRARTSAPCGASTTESVVATFEAGDAELELHLSCAATRAETAEDLRGALRYVVLRNLPHGARAPDWRFRVLTPSSSFSDGVEMVALEGGALSLRIRTPLEALYGFSLFPPCIPPADGLTAPRCYVRFEHHIPLDLTLRAPFDPYDLR
jgi:hypothetical protein